MCVTSLKTELFGRMHMRHNIVEYNILVYIACTLYMINYACFQRRRVGYLWGQMTSLAEIKNYIYLNQDNRIWMGKWVQLFELAFQRRC